MNLYESFAQATQLGDLHTCLMMDMKACQEDDVRLLCHLTPSIYTEVSVCAGLPGRGAAVQGGLIAYSPDPPLPTHAGLSGPLPPIKSEKMSFILCFVV